MLTRHLNMKSLSYFAGDIKLSHSIFALPFVFSTLVFIEFDWALESLLWILLCMVSARSFAMGMNRYLDRNIDHMNPRTKNRMIPSGKLSPTSSLSWSLCFGGLFILSAFQFNTLTGLLSPLVLLILGSYPLMKHWTALAHFYLGACLGLSPMGASLALTGSIRWEVFLLSLSICLWTGGFDILYALQDQAFDKKHALKSVPAKLGVRGALYVSRLCFALMIALLCGIGHLRQSHLFYFIGVFVVASLLFWEQWIVRDSTEEKISPNINMAFFNINACIGIVYYIFVHMDDVFKV